MFLLSSVDINADNSLLCDGHLRQQSLSDHNVSRCYQHLPTRYFSSVHHCCCRIFSNFSQVKTNKRLI